jgi:cellulose synthase/poly-beta-1,6-N-acetylglucosamine synthase-like glycosyltransferase
MEGAAKEVLSVIGITVIFYFVVLNSIYLAFTGISGFSLVRQMRQRSYEHLEEDMASPLSPPISILLPAYNEEVGIGDSVESLLDLRYPLYEVIVVDDGSTDATLNQLRDEFDLVPFRPALRDAVRHGEVTEAYVSRRDTRLTVLRKVNGGKADALNCGLCAASYPYVCSVDADTLIEEEALLRLAGPILDDPERVVATGGIVRIANGCRVEGGRVVDVGLPKGRLATLQVVEYFRAFLVGRIAWSRLGALLIVSGAFGLFKRSVVEDVGGWLTTTVGEDAELVARIHHGMREKGRPYSVQFVPDPVCWTEAPETFKVLSRQRRRWQRGLAETLQRHRRMVGNPRYGVFGAFALPYFLLFELIGPALELSGFVILPIAFALGLLKLQMLVAFMLVSVVLGILLSVSALALEELSFRRYSRNRDVIRLLGYAVLDNFGYRQLNDLYRAMGIIDFLRKRGGWGEMERRGVGGGAGKPVVEPGARVLPGPS